MSCSFIEKLKRIKILRDRLVTNPRSLFTCLLLAKESSLNQRILRKLEISAKFYLAVTVPVAFKTSICANNMARKLNKNLNRHQESIKKAHNEWNIFLLISVDYITTCYWNTEPTWNSNRWHLSRSTTVYAR